VVTTLLGLFWGLAQGMRHALEPDHLAAVSTLVADRRSARSAASYALAWGVGHALVLLVFGGALLAVRGHVPARIGAAFELLVATMLVVLGLRGLRLAFVRPGVDPADHEDGGPHVHPGSADHVHLSGFTITRRPLIVGCVHGLAGSGALAALVMPGMKSALLGLLYLALYGGGAALGMAMLAGVVGVPMARLVRTPRGVPVLLGATGALSLVFGLAWGWTAAGLALS
jgi:high-affinity nickel-transport protein